ncbi:TonB-dependent siderophore receptor [Rhizobium sp. CFBP 8762]|uniref:TonB-dependent siderophore receptor n=1 Tax=Rhizobium sp. CFBP 8762 TaxID=2775279 RepID=UPI0017871202|nr:TonB-dependent siderophore receptor [Rhizobium sp. CFBP 8762]MBD8553496.1 TonB-dependent siderophore receptor [Rhizobium sp. CFBP 8762]
MRYTTSYTTTMLLAGSALLTMSLAAHAQSSATPAQLETISVEDSASRETTTGPVKGYVATKSSSGSKSDTPITEIPQSVSVVGREELRDRNVVTKVDEALRYTPGVLSAPFGEDPDTDWFYIRGFDATQTGVFLDGLNQYSFGFGGFQMDAYSLERIEVLKGPASVLYGGANPGGIINLIRKRPQQEKLLETEIGINNFGNAYFGFDVNDKLNDDGTVTYRVTGKISGGDQYSDYSEDLRGFIMPQVTVQPDDSTKVSVFGYFSGLDQVHVGNGFLPYVGTVVPASYGKIDRDAFFGEPSSDFGRYTQALIGYELEHEFDNGWKLSQNARYSYLDKKENSTYPYGYTASGDLYRIGFEHTTRVDAISIDNRAEKEFDTGGLNHTFLAGVDYKYYRLDHIQASPSWPAAATPISPVRPVYGLPQPALTPYLDQIVSLSQIGVYAQDQIRFSDGWLVTLNGRYDRVEIDSNSVVGNNFETKDGALSGRAGLAYEFANGVTPYISAATFFNPLIGINVTNTPFKPEEGYQYEGGIKYEPTFIDGLLTASVFQITKQNAAISLPGTFFYDQLGEVRSTGFELEGKVNLNQNWMALASYDYTDLEVTKDANPALVGKRPFLVPRSSAKLWLDYTVTDGALEGLSIGGGVRYQGSSYADNLNTLKVPNVTLVDAAIRYEKNDWTAALNVNNLFDKNYVKGCQGEFVCGYGDQRQITLSLRKKW